jgi:CheY-like chemotaxis protein
MHKRRVLVMDDDDDVRFLLENILLKLNFQTEMATNGQEAVAMYAAALDRAEPYVAAILDLKIPGGEGGLAVARKILALDARAVLYVSSGDEFDPVMLRFQDYGFTGRVNKPIFLRDAETIFKAIL